MARAKHGRAPAGKGRAPGKRRAPQTRRQRGRLERSAGAAAQTEMLYGIHPVQEMLRAGRRQCRALWMAHASEQQRLMPLGEMAAARGISVHAADDTQLAGLCGDGRHQGVVAEVSPLPLSALSEVLAAAAAAPTGALLLVLDSISDPQNLGAILRSAQCTGVAAVVLPKDRSVRPTPTVSKASAGALEHTRLVQVTNLTHTLEALKKGGFWVAGTAIDGGQSLFECDLSGPLALVIGSEGRGIRPLVRQTCDFLLTIPQTGAIGSLNASAAAAVILYEAFRQRRPNPANEAGG